MAVYLDYNAASLPDSSVVEIITNILKEVGNASSVHGFGRHRRALIESARADIISDLGGSNDWEVVFTSSGTAANNLILRSFESRFASGTEHASVSAVPNLQNIKVDNNGLIDEDDLRTKVCDSALFSIQGANSETGILQDIKKLSHIIHEQGGIFHSDMVQWLGKCDFNLEESGVDAISLSGHKFGTPSGVGALVYRKSLSLQSLIFGGGQEQGLISGSENVAMIAGLAKACSLLQARVKRMAELQKLRDDMETTLQKQFADLQVVGSGVARLPNTSCLIMPNIAADGTVVAMDLAGFAVSAGSACSLGRLQKQSALDAMGYGNLSTSALRISLGVETTEAQVQDFVKAYGNFISKVQNN